MVDWFKHYLVSDLSENTESIMRLVRARGSDDGDAAGDLRREHGAHRVPDAGDRTSSLGERVAVVVQRVPSVGTELEV